jgi:hypothetical protein
METLLQDIRFGFRQLMKQPGFAALAIISMALGIGANTSIFSLADTVLLRPLAVKQPSQLVELYGTMHNGAEWSLQSYLNTKTTAIVTPSSPVFLFTALSLPVSQSTTPASASGDISFPEITSMCLA